MTVDKHAWPLAQLGEALAEAGRRMGQVVTAPGSPPRLCATDADALAAWLNEAAPAVGIEAQAVETGYAQVETLLRHSPPVLIRLPVPDPLLLLPGDTFLLLIKRRGDRLLVLGPTGKSHWVATTAVHARLCAHHEAPLLAGIDDFLSEAKVADQRRGQVRTALLGEQLAPVRLTDCWLLRRSPTASLWEQLRQHRLFGSVAAIFGVEILSQFLLILAWALIGRGALQGSFEWGWLWAWALLFLTLIPVQSLVTWTQQRLSLQRTTVLRQHLLYGALQHGSGTGAPRRGGLLFRPGAGCGGPGKPGTFRGL